MPLVVSHRETWIETMALILSLGLMSSSLTERRGLKLTKSRYLSQSIRSSLTERRGLKPSKLFFKRNGTMSSLTERRGLKPGGSAGAKASFGVVSHRETWIETQYAKEA